MLCCLELGLVWVNLLARFCGETDRTGVKWARMERVGRGARRSGIDTRDVTPWHNGAFTHVLIRFPAPSLPTAGPCVYSGLSHLHAKKDEGGRGAGGRCAIRLIQEPATIALGNLYNGAGACGNVAGIVVTCHWRSSSHWELLESHSLERARTSAPLIFLHTNTILRTGRDVTTERKSPVP